MRRREVNVKARNVVVGDVTVEDRPRRVLKVLRKTYLHPSSKCDRMKVYLVVNDRNARGFEFREFDSEDLVRVKRLNSVDSERVRIRKVGV